MKVSFLLALAFLLTNSWSNTLGQAIAPHTSTVARPALRISPGTVQNPSRFEVLVDWDGQNLLFMESSTNLTNWTYVDMIGMEFLDFTDIISTNAPLKVYRAREYVITVSGSVRHAINDSPLADATISASFYRSLAGETETDMNGAFSLRVPARGRTGRFQITAAKPGFNPESFDRSYAPWDFESSLSATLIPEDYPPNDDFQDRAALEGTGMTVEVSTIGAWMEPRHFLEILYDDYSDTYPHDVWYSWTAPRDGALLLRGDHVDLGVVVYTGDSLQELVRVWDSSDSQDLGFVVQEGVEYQIGVGTGDPVNTRFTLWMIPLRPPTILRHPWPGSTWDTFRRRETYAVGERLLLSVAASGTKPLSYQWRKDGLEIPAATNDTFFVDVALDDAGAYSVSVSNAAGAVLSEEILITVVEERPHLPEFMQGTWAQETRWGQAIITFTDTEFSAKWATDDTSAGSGHYSLTETSWYGRYHLLMTYSEVFPGDIDDFTLSVRSPGEYRYSGTIRHSGGSSTYVEGTFTRLAQP